MNRVAAIALLILAIAMSSCAINSSNQSQLSMPINLVPEDASEIVFGTETAFVWAAVPAAEFYQFHLVNQIDGDISEYHMDRLIPEKVCKEQRCSVVFNVEFPAINGHAWRVRAMSEAGASAWSRSLFTVLEP